MLLPDNAPFTAEQRSFLSQLLTACLRDPSNAEDNGALSTHATAGAATAPWHDMTLPIDERMKLAEGRTRQERLYAAMGQQDCGQCGYDCKDYAAALNDHREADITRCVPGGRDTRRVLKLLLEVPDDVPAAPVSPKPQTRPDTIVEKTGSSRSNPVIATFQRRARLTRASSDRVTSEVAFELTAEHGDYAAGDALGVMVANEPALVNRLLIRLNAHPDDLMNHQGRAISARELLTTQLDLNESSDALLNQLLSGASTSDQSALATLAQQGPERGCDVLELLERFPAIAIDLVSFQKSALPLQPRLYSISSAPSLHPREAHLVVGLVSYQRGDRQRNGVASGCLTQRLRDGARVPVFIHSNPGFRLPDGDRDLIMIGPGTGVAPFLSFIDERRACGHRGRNWLFFGNPRRRSDYLYEERLQRYVDDGSLAAIDLAFSRDTDMKVYVQHRMQEQSARLWEWIDQGAVFAVCGDASRMAIDVHAALLALVEDHRRCSRGDAEAYVRQMAADGRYLRDCY
jgi:sulfite reductase (NADPH) flavoprotein alpha-component